MNLYLRKDGRYESRVPNGKKPDGKRAFLYVLARTKEQCIERVQAIHRQHRPQGYCTLTVAELFSEWHRSILHRVKESTAANYTMKADKHILPAFGDMPVSTLTADSIYDFIAEKQKVGFSPPIYRRYCNSGEDNLQICCQNIPDFQSSGWNCAAKEKIS